MYSKQIMICTILVAAFSVGYLASAPIVQQAIDQETMFNDKIALVGDIVNIEDGNYTTSDSCNLKEIFDSLNTKNAQLVYDSTAFNAVRKKECLHNFFNLFLNSVIIVDAFLYSQSLDRDVFLIDDYQQRQLIIIQVLQGLHTMLQKNWYSGGGLLLEHAEWNIILYDIIKKMTNVRSEQTCQFLTMFLRMYGYNDVAAIDFPDLYAQYPCLCEDYLRVSSQLHMKLFLTDTAEQKTLSEKINALKRSVFVAHDLLLGKTASGCSGDYALNILNTWLGYVHKLVYRLESYFFLMPKIMHNCGKNSKKLDVLINDRMIRSSFSFVRFSNNALYQKYMYSYQRLVDFYLQQIEKTAFNADYMISLYTLLKQLEELKEINKPWPFLAKGELFIVVDNMEEVIRSIMFDINNINQHDSLFNKILSGEWITQIMAVEKQNKTLFESIKQAARGDTQDFKNLALKGLLYSSPVVAYGILQKLAPNVSQDIRNKIMQFLAEDQKQSADNPVVIDKEASPEEQEKLLNLIEKNPDILDMMIKNNPQLTDVVAEQVKKKLVN